MHSIMQVHRCIYSDSDISNSRIWVRYDALDHHSWQWQKHIKDFFSLLRITFRIFFVKSWSLRITTENITFFYGLSETRELRFSSFPEKILNKAVAKSVGPGCVDLPSFEWCNFTQCRAKSVTEGKVACIRSKVWSFNHLNSEPSNSIGNVTKRRQK